MKKGGLISFLLLAILVTNNLSQSNSRGFVCKPVKLISNVRQKAAYYISISRADAGQFSKKKWQQTANTLKRGGISAFFAAHQSLPASSQLPKE